MQRDPVPVMFGVLLTMLLSCCFVMAGLKAGIMPGVSPLVILFAWGAFSRRVARGGGTTFLNLAQVPGSAGMAVTAGVIFTAPLVQILHTDVGVEQLLARGVELPASPEGGVLWNRELLEILGVNGCGVPDVDVPTLILLSLGGALLGFGFVGLGVGKFLTDPTLPAPEARACETMIAAAASRPEDKPRLGSSLVAGLFASFSAPLLVGLGLAKDHVVIAEKEIAGRNAFRFDLPFNPIYIGIGGLLSLATALLIVGGSSLRLIGDMLLVGVEDRELAALWPGDSMRWVGGGAMTVAVGYSLFRFLGIRPRGDGAPDPLVELPPGTRRGQMAAVLAGMAIVIGWLLVTDGFTAFSLSMSVALLVCASLMVVLGAILSLQIGSSASPVSGTIFVTTLVLCLVAIGVDRRQLSDVVVLTPLVVAACVAVCAANDSSQDYKTLQLCGLPVRIGFAPQLIGLLAGCLVVPIVLRIAHEAYVLGSDELTAPQAKMFATLVNGLLVEDALPWYPILVGLAVGVLAVGMDVAGHRRGVQLPSMALAVGIYLPAHLGIGILIGSLFRRVAERGARQSRESILAAAGLITGAALYELIVGIAIVFLAFDPEALDIFTGSPRLPNTVAVLGILGLGSILWSNSRQRASS